MQFFRGPEQNELVFNKPVKGQNSHALGPLRRLAPRMWFRADGPVIITRCVCQQLECRYSTPFSNHWHTLWFSCCKTWVIPEWELDQDGVLKKLGSHFEEKLKYILLQMNYVVVSFCESVWALKSLDQGESHSGLGDRGEGSSPWEVKSYTANANLGGLCKRKLNSASHPLTW